MNFEPTFINLVPLYIGNGCILFFFLLHCTIFRHGHKNEELRKTEQDTPFLTVRVKECWFWITDPIFKFFVWFKISPNTITTFGLFLSVIAAFCFSRGWIASAGYFVVFAGSMDFFDGRVARYLKQESKSGAFWDAVLDRVSEGFLFLGLIVMYQNHWMFYVTFFAFLTSILVSYIKARGEIMGINVRVGIMKRGERLAYIGAPSMLWPMIFPFVHPWLPSIPYHAGTTLGLCLILILGIHTAYVRFTKVYGELRNPLVTDITVND